jgi:hypothetical protein
VRPTSRGQHPAVAAIRPAALTLATALVLLGARTPAAADSIWLDFADFSASLYGLAGQETALKQSITDAVVNDYSLWPSFDIRHDFDLLTPGDQAPTGAYSHIDIGGNDGDPGQIIFGVAEDIDWRNQNPSDSVLVYSDEYALWDSTYFDDYTRLTNALAGTTSHELGHILGLSHHDAFGPVGTSTVPAYTANPFTGGGADTNKHLMATGPTGISKAERASDRSFGDREIWKLDAATGQVAIWQEGTLHATQLTAQAIGGGSTVDVIGALGAAGEQDWYSFMVRAGTLIDLEVYSARCNRFTDPVDAYFELYDPTGALILTRDDYWQYSTATDPALLDYMPSQTGTYYLALRGFGNDTGDYELYFHSAEPGTWLTMVCGLALLLILAPRAHRPR